MQVGSLVELVNDKWNHEQTLRPYGLVYPVKDVVYTVREVCHNEGRQSIRLEEIVNPILPFKEGPSEGAFQSWRFIELNHLWTWNWCRISNGITP